MNALVQRTLDVAASQEGVQEEGSNRGPQVEAYLRSTHRVPGEPWCAAFVYWCISNAAGELNLSDPFPLTAYCPDINNWARRHGVLENTPEAGDVFLLYGETEEGKLARHTGFVASVDGVRFRTIEGNTNLDGSDNGIGVFRLTRSNGDKYRFVRWGSLADEAGDEPFTLVLSGNPLVAMPVRNGRALCPVRKWGEALGFKVEWNQEEQVPLFDGNEVNTQIALIGKTAYAPIHDLAEAAGLQIKVDASSRKVYVTR